MSATKKRPIIRLQEGKLPEAVDEIEKILVENLERLRIFQRGNELLRVVSLSESRKSGLLNRPRGTVQLVPITPPALVEIFEREAWWYKGSGKQSHKVDCPLKIATAYLSRVGEWRVPELFGFIEAPVVLPDGNVVRKAGFDATSGLYLTEDWPELIGHPSLDDARRALTQLLEPFAQFPFVGDEDRAVLVTGILTALQRRILLSAPIFGFTAPVPRTGKSLLADSIAIIATGREAPAMAVSTESDEMRKAILACLREGHVIVNLDNVDQPLASPDLSRAITQPEYADRVLGVSRLLRLPTNVLWTATGNNLTLRGDLTVRALVCRLDSGVERPEARRFAIRNLKAFLAEHRRELVRAAATILWAYELAGRPDMRLEPWGGFDGWSATVRSALVWAGMADPCETRKYVIEDDPDRDDSGALLAAWHSHFQNTAVTTAEVIVATEETYDPTLCQALKTVLGGRKGLSDSKKLGDWCKDHRGRVIAGLKLVKAGAYGHAARWAVRQLGGADGNANGDSGVSPTPARNPNGTLSDPRETDSTNSTTSTAESASPASDESVVEGR